jgi:hypothetical protein
MLNRESKYRLKEFLKDAEETVHVDLLEEILSELFSDNYGTDEDRITGITEAIEFITDINVSK